MPREDDSLCRHLRELHKRHGRPDLLAEDRMIDCHHALLKPPIASNAIQCHRRWRWARQSTAARALSALNVPISNDNEASATYTSCRRRFESGEVPRRRTWLSGRGGGSSHPPIGSAARTAASQSSDRGQVQRHQLPTDASMCGNPPRLFACDALRGRICDSVCTKRSRAAAVEPARTEDDCGCIRGGGDCVWSGVVVYGC